MSARGSDILWAAATADNSYAGPFAYDNQSPMKTFMGQSPCVPLPVMLEVENTPGSGNPDSPYAKLRPQDIEALRKVIGMDVASCGVRCVPWQCIAEVAGRSLSEQLGSSEGKACMTQSRTCFQTCLAGMQA